MTADACAMDASAPTRARTTHRRSVLLGDDGADGRAGGDAEDARWVVRGRGGGGGSDGTTTRAWGEWTIVGAVRAMMIFVLALACVAALVYASTRLEIDLYEDVVPHVRNPMKFFALNVAVATFGVIPGAASATCVAAGILFGTLGGVTLCVSSASVGAVVSFTLSRYFARPWVERTFVRDGGRFKALDEAVTKDGPQIVILVRLSPFSPFTVASYVLGLTSVPFLSYVVATFVGLFPSSFVYVYVGDTGRRASGADGATALEIIFYVVGLIMTLFVSYKLAVLAQETMRKKVGPDWDPSEQDDDAELDVFGSPIEDDDDDDDEVPLVTNEVSDDGRGNVGAHTKSVV
jgi:uncharacterized membrane protein YdjX (TVP38/TMEM64 family)